MYVYLKLKQVNWGLRAVPAFDHGPDVLVSHNRRMVAIPDKVVSGGR